MNKRYTTKHAAPQDQHEKDIENTNELIAAEDFVETTAYLANAPDCCSPSEHLDNMLGMLGANVMDADIYHSESEHTELTL